MKQDSSCVKKRAAWQEDKSWAHATVAWDQGAEKAREEQPIRSLKRLPKMPGITKETAQGLRWKAFKWMVQKDEGGELFRHICRRPLRHGWAFIRSLIGGSSYTREGDFFYYGVEDEADFRQKVQQPDALLVVGFSYCQKPFECPSGRFTPGCIHDPENPICRQCVIGRAINLLPNERIVPLAIPTVHYISNRMFEMVEQHPDKKVFFLITACEMTLKMFGDWGNMSGIRGIGIRLDGRICNTMRAFALSEEGIKPGLTVLTGQTEKRLFDLVRFIREGEEADEATRLS